MTAGTHGEDTGASGGLTSFINGLRDGGVVVFYRVLGQLEGI